jgi:hypothetical protein
MKTQIMTRSRRIGFLLALVSACVTITEPLPPGAAPLTPLAEYQAWWQDVEACSGINGDLAAVSWYEIPHVREFTIGNNPYVAGYWQPYHHSITLAGLRINDADLVRHEMLHALLKEKGHPAEYFVQKCGSLVTPPAEGT